jgi:hypothetical protein
MKIFNYQLTHLLLLSTLIALPPFIQSEDHGGRGDRGNHGSDQDRGGDHGGHGDRGSSQNRGGDHGGRGDRGSGQNRGGDHGGRGSGQAPQQSFRREAPQQSSSHETNQQNRGNDHDLQFQRSNASSRSPSMSRSYERSRTSSADWDKGSLKNTAQSYRQSTIHRNLDQNEVRKHTQDFRASFNDQRKRYNDATKNLSLSVRSRHPEYKTWFHDRYYNKYNRYPNYWRNNVNWWRGTPWNGVYFWLGWAPSIYPYYYYEGYPIQIDASWPGYADEVRTSYAPSADQGDWMPLGVFSLGATINDVAYSDIFMQLAINRNGDISGIYYNSTTDQSYPIEGAVDSNTQEAYWEVPGQPQAPRMSSGIYNLTQDVASVELTFTGGITQNWFLIRVNEQ